MATEPDKSPPARREGRSPGYPYFAVDKALERAGQLHRQEGSHWAPLTSAASAWGYSPKSSGGRQTLATMRYYALIEVTGEGDARRIRVTELAKRILLDEREDQTEKRLLIREVALSPSAHRALFDEYPNGLPSDGTVMHFLMFTKGYNRDAARDLLDEYKVTASYIGLYEPAKGVDKIDDEDDDRDPPPTVKVGDRVQATVNGQDVFPNGAKVLGFSEDRAYVFTDQSRSGVKLEEITVLEPATVPQVQERPQIPASLLVGNREDNPPPAGQRKAMFPLEEGDVTLLFPEDITADGLGLLADYLDIFLKRERKKKES